MLLKKNKLLSLFVCSATLLGCIQAHQHEQQVEQQQDQGIVKYIRDSLQRRYSEDGYHDNSGKKGRKWVRYDEVDDEDEDEDDYEDYDDEQEEEEEDCEDDQDKDFEWNPSGKKHYKPPPIPYITFIDPRATTTAKTTSTHTATTDVSADTSTATTTDHLIYSTTINADLGVGELIGTSTTTDDFWGLFAPYGIRDVFGLTFDAPKPWEVPPEYPPEPICYDNTATKDQVDYLNHFTGMFGSFVVAEGGFPNIEGPVAAKTMQAIANINTLALNEDYCRQAREIERYGLVVDELSLGGHVNGSIAFNKLNNLIVDQTPQDCQVFAGVSNNISTRVFDMFPNVFYQTSSSLASYQATYRFNADNSVSSVLAADLNQQYMIFTFPPCSDQQCDAAPTDTDSLSNDILKGNTSWVGPPGSYFYEDKPTLLNIPVYVGQNYTITSEFVNAGGGTLDPCHTVFHFYAVDQNGAIVTDPAATFNLIRGDNVVINGLVLAPQANIYDAPTGGFGGQVVTMQTFYSQGATIYDYSSVGTCRVGRFACWPHTNDIIVEYPYSIVNASYHEDALEITTTTADAETTTVVLSSQGIVDYTTVPTTSHSTDTVTHTATVNGTSTEAVLTTKIAQVIYLVNVTENAIDHTTATTTLGRTRTVANQNADPTTSTLVLVATALVESVITRTTTVTGVLLPPQPNLSSVTSATTTTSSSIQTTATLPQTTAVVPESEHIIEDCTIVDHHHHNHHKHRKSDKKHRYKEEDDNNDEDKDDEDEDDENEE
ncbi:hypothetical protein MBANPS3_009196 [Mucor bainieri]